MGFSNPIQPTVPVVVEAGVAGPGATVSNLLLEDGSNLLLEDGTSVLVLE